MHSYLFPLLNGLGIGLGLIIAIGMQNAFVLKQGLLKNHTFLIASLCSVIDAIIITAGINGLGSILSKNELLLKIFHWGGICFLFIYGTTAFIRCYQNLNLHVDNPELYSLKKTLLTLLSVTLLNPHTYLDSCILMGSIASNFNGQDRIYFNIGAVLASFIWFFSLSFGARLLRKFFENPLSWKILDFMIGSTMYIIAISLIYTSV